MNNLKSSVLISLLAFIQINFRFQKRRTYLRFSLFLPRKIIYLFCFVFFTLSSFQLAFAQSCPGDINQDGVVNIADFGLLSANYGNTCEDPGDAEYPEGTVHCIPGGADVAEVLNPETGRIWMDRNLGASRVATSLDDELAYGDLYQWGRFSDGHQCRDSETTSVLSSAPDPGHNQFITVESSPGDWLIAQNNILWQGPNAPNNPCPDGFRLPTYNDFFVEIGTWISNDAEGAFNSPLKFPNTGRRHSDGNIYSFLLSRGYYHSSRAIGSSNTRSMLFRDDYAGALDGPRVFGYAIRCIKQDAQTGWDCPDLELNITDLCDDDDPNTVNDFVTGSCECFGFP